MAICKTEEKTIFMSTKAAIKHSYDKTPYQHSYIITDIVDTHIRLRITHTNTLTATYITNWDYFEPGIRLVFTLNGQTHLRFDNGSKNHQSITLTSNQGLLLPIKHKTLGDKCFIQGEQIEIVIFFDYYYLENLGISPTLIKMFRDAHLLPFNLNTKPMKEKLNLLLQHYRTHATTPKKLIDQLTIQAFEQFCSIQQQPQHTSYHCRMLQVGKFLQCSTQTPNIQTLAKLCLTNRTILQKEFQKTFGVSIVKYGRECRLHAAFNALKQGKSVSQVAYLAGYDNPECFSKAFKQFFGRNPSSFRNSS